MTFSVGWLGAVLAYLVVAITGGGLALLLAVTTLSVFKPWGKTRYGRGDSTAGRGYFVIGVIGMVGVVAPSRR